MAGHITIIHVIIQEVAVAELKLMMDDMGNRRQPEGFDALFSITQPLRGELTDTKLRAAADDPPKDRTHQIMWKDIRWGRKTEWGEH